MRYLVTDCETGGIGREFTLLSTYFGIMDKSKNLIKELDLKLKPNDGIYVLSEEGMKVNQIDIRNWNGITYKEARPLIYNFLAEGAGYERDVRGVWRKTINSKRMRLIGQQVDKDIERIIDTIVTRESWDKFVATVPLDTLYIATFLRDRGLLPLKSISLRELGNYFGLDTTDLHNARKDAILTWQVYDKLGELINEPKDRCECDRTN